METNPTPCLLSVIIPVYNVQKYLKSCVDSVLCQNRLEDDVEILLIDDGSTDNSPVLCDEYAENHAQIRTFHKENGGLSDARNYGIQKAQGQYIVFLDSDDFWEQGYIDEIKDIVNATPDVDLIFGNYIQYYEKENKKIYAENFLTRADAAGKTGVEILLSILRREHQCISSACKNVYARRLLVDNQLYFKKGILCEDAFWSPNVYFRAQKCSVLQNSYYYYRKQRENSITNTYNLKLLRDILYICNYWIDYIQKSSYSDEFKQLFINEYAVHFRSNIQKVYSGKRKDRKQAIALVRDNLSILALSSRPGHIQLKKLIDRIGLKPVLIFLNIRYRIWQMRKTS